MLLSNIKVITTKLPSYLQALLQDDSTIKLVFQEIQKKKVEVLECSQNDTTELGDQITNLELTGSPLKIDLQSDDDVCNDLIPERPPNWTYEEAHQGPLFLSEARNFINCHLKSKNLNEAMFCLCNAKDEHKTVGLGVIANSSTFSRFLVFVLPCCYEDDLDTTIEYFKKDHIKNVRSNAEIKVTSTKRYDIFGYNLKKCPHLNSEYNGNISLDVYTSDANTFSQDNSHAKMNLQVVVGHNNSPLLIFWEEFCLIQRFIKELENIRLLKNSTVISTSDSLDCAEITSLISDVVNTVSSSKKIVCKSLDLKNLRQLNILDKLWSILKYCGTLSDLRDSFHFFFEELAEKQVNMHVLKEDKSTIGEIVNGILDGRTAVPTLNFSQCLELLIELGLEKLKNDYVVIIDNIHGSIKEAVSKKWSELTWDNSQISASRSSQRRTRISINPKAPITDLTSSKLKFTYLDSLLETIEFMFLYKENLPLLEESFDAFCESLSKKLIDGFQNIVKYSDIQQHRLRHFSCNISSADASIFIKDGFPIASTIKMRSAVDLGEVVTVFLVSEYPIFPPIVCKNYDISNDENDNRILYVTKLEKYVQHF